MDAKTKDLTNVKQTSYVPFVSSVMPSIASILPDRFTSTSGPVDTPLLSPGFTSDSGPQEQQAVRGKE